MTGYALRDHFDRQDASRNKKRIISVQGLIGKAATDKTEPVISDRLKTIRSLKYCHD